MSHSHTYSIDDYKRIIDIICARHHQYNREWLENQEGNTFNLKKKQVRHVTSDDPENMNFINIDFLNYMESYKSGLYDLYADVMIELSSNYSIPITGRVKNDDSIVSKLHRKRFDENGKFPINKYLNDLLGFRIVDQNFTANFHELTEHIKFLDGQGKRRIRASERQVEDYKAYHIYFMGSLNSCFPIELQVWDAKHERSNLDSHKVYKKDYTYWPTKYKDG